MPKNEAVKVHSNLKNFSTLQSQASLNPFAHSTPNKNKSRSRRTNIGDFNSLSVPRIMVSTVEPGERFTQTEQRQLPTNYGSSLNLLPKLDNTPLTTQNSHVFKRQLSSLL